MNDDKLLTKNKQMSHHIELYKKIQFFLSKFKKYTGTQLFSFQFISNPNVYSVDVQIPDLWIKTRKPFDKNECFYTEIKGTNIFPT
jgi:hypothetical protein